MSDAQERLDNARQTLELLYPGGSEVAADRTFAVAPSPRQPRLLVPAESSRAATAALRAYGGRLSAKARYGALAYRLLIQATRGATLLPAYPVGRNPDGDIESLLGEVFGREVRVAVHLTPARANRKPILQVLDPAASTPIGFAKVATNPLTTKLLQDEAAALERLAAASDLSFRVPPVLHLGEFNGRLILVTGPLATWQRGRLPKPREIIRAASEIAELAPINVSRVRESAFWHRMQGDLPAIPDPRIRQRVGAAGERIAAAIGAREIGFGLGHGDFSPWNMWFTGHRLLIWDWERLAADVPVGADLVHYKLQDAVTRKGEAPGPAAAAVLAGAPDPVVAILHLYSLAVRYAKDDQAGAGASIGEASDWLLPAIDGALHRSGAPA